MTLRELAVYAASLLKEKGTADPEYDSRALIYEAFSLDPASYLSLRNKEVTDYAARERFLSMLEARTRRVPLQHILGRTEFMGLGFEVNRDVLIPRPDTETLVELVLNDNREKDISVLDLCTGSGCIGISLKKLGGYRRVLCTDISEAALPVAARNASRICGDDMPEMRLSDMFGNINESFDIIVSNPPYIKSSEIAGLEPEVRIYDPLNALDGGRDGLDFYRIIADGASERLNAGGRIYLETGYDQAEELSELFGSAGYRNISVFKDIAGNNRVLRADK